MESECVRRIKRHSENKCYSLRSAINSFAYCLRNPCVLRPFRMELATVLCRAVPCRRRSVRSDIGRGQFRCNCNTNETICNEKNEIRIFPVIAFAAERVGCSFARVSSSPASSIACMHATDSQMHAINLPLDDVRGGGDTRELLLAFSCFVDSVIGCHSATNELSAIANPAENY